MSARAADALRYLGALATVVVGAVHLEQYADFIHDVPTIGVLFLLSGAGAGAVAIMLATRRALLGALGAIALSAGALVSIAISMTNNGLFNYTEPTLRTPIAIAVVAEALGIVALLAYLVVANVPGRRTARVDWSGS